LNFTAAIILLRIIPAAILHTSEYFSQLI